MEIQSKEELVKIVVSERNVRSEAKTCKAMW